MKHIAKLGYFTIIAFALTIFVAAQQSESNAQQQNQSTQDMEDMHGMMQDCHKNMQSMQESNTKTKQDIEAAQQSNDPAKMRAALDEADKALSSMNDHMNTCMSMMNMMQGMHGKGAMSGQQTSPPKQ